MYEAVIKSLDQFFIASPPNYKEHVSLNDVDPRILLRIGDNSHSKLNKHASYFHSNPISSHPGLSHRKSLGAYPSLFSNDERDAFFAYRVSLAGENSCFLAHTAHVIGAMAHLQDRLVSITIDNVEPKRILKNLLQKKTMNSAKGSGLKIFLPNSITQSPRLVDHYFIKILCSLRSIDLKEFREKLGKSKRKNWKNN